MMQLICTIPGSLVRRDKKFALFIFWCSKFLDIHKGPISSKDLRHIMCGKNIVFYMI